VWGRRPSIERPGCIRSLARDSNPEPTAYKAAALPIVRARQTHQTKQSPTGESNSAQDAYDAPAQPLCERGKSTFKPQVRFELTALRVPGACTPARATTAQYFTLHFFILKESAGFEPDSLTRALCLANRPPDPQDAHFPFLFSTFQRMAQDSNLTPAPGACRFPGEPCPPDRFTILMGGWFSCFSFLPATNHQPPITNATEGAGLEPDAVPGTTCFRGRLRHPDTFTFHTNALTES
jgi:hypothetical protein